MRNILYICTKDPRLINGGNEQRTHLLWNALKKLGNVYTIVYVNKSEENPIYENEDSPICFASNNLAVYNRTIRGFVYALLSKIIGFAFLPYIYPVKYKPKELYKGVEFDLVVCRYIHNPARYHLWAVAPTWVDLDDHPVQVYETVYEKRLPCWLRPICRFVARKQLDLFLKKIRGGWIANQKQAELLSDKISFLPNIPLMPSSEYNATSSIRKYLLTIGAMGYKPNYIGVDRFLIEIWPSFHTKYPEVKYMIGGRNAPQELVERWNTIDGVEYAGYIENLDMVYEQCIATVVPIYSGGGTCIKTLESLSHSRVCLSTRFGARGLESESIVNSGLFIFDNANSFIDAYKKLLDTEKIKEYEYRVHSFIIREYSKERFNNSIFDAILN